MPGTATLVGPTLESPIVHPTLAMTAAADTYTFTVPTSGRKSFRLQLLSDVAWLYSDDGTDFLRVPADTPLEVELKFDFTSGGSAARVVSVKTVSGSGTLYVAEV